MSIQTLIDAAAKQAAFYTEQADQSARAAADAHLLNVRGCCLQAETSWRELAALTATRVASLQADAAKIEARIFPKN